MTDKSAAELERDAEVARARVADTAESIRNKMSPGQLIDEFTGLFTGGDGATALTNLKLQIRDNPLPLSLVGAGLAWLMLGSGTSSTERSATQRSGRSFGQASGSNATGSAGAGFEGADHGASGSSIGEKLSEAAGAVGSMASGAADAAMETAAAARQRLRSGGTQYASDAADMANRATRSAQDILQREPLVLAALGLAVGTAIGAMLPHTAVEDEQIGPYGDKIRETAEGLLEKGVEGAKDVAAEAYQTIKDEADRQGLSGDGTKSIAAQVGDVVKTAATRTEEAIREKVGARTDPE